MLRYWWMSIGLQVASSVRGNKHWKTSTSSAKQVSVYTVGNWLDCTYVYAGLLT